MKRKPKKKRRLLGIGHPYFMDIPVKAGLTRGVYWPTALVLLDRDFGKDATAKTLNPCGIGAWQKVRVYLEWE